MSEESTPASRLRAAIDALGNGKQARLDPQDLCDVLHEIERLQARQPLRPGLWFHEPDGSIRAPKATDL